jgi:hypothetical protein
MTMSINNYNPHSSHHANRKVVQQGFNTNGSVHLDQLQEPYTSHVDEEDNCIGGFV